MRSALTACLPFAMAAAAMTLLLPAQDATTKPTAKRDTPSTVPEASSYAKTSRAIDVERFVDACGNLSHGDRLQVRIAGKSHEGRAMMLVKVALPTSDKNSNKLRALVIGNIHAGEVEGKEAVQELLREFASGQHESLLKHCDVWFLPIYNVDGNEAIKVGNRRGQNGPDAVGQRANAQDLDLNRDFVKADAPETRTLLTLFRDIDPHLFVDLHTTNGSHHGYHLTYAPSLSANLDHRIDAFGRELLAKTRGKMKQRGFETFDYGNFETRDWDGGGAPRSKNGTRGWYTYDHRARYGVNYFGLRNRIGILSEAYSYADFATRIAATRAFVLTLLEQVVEHKQAAFDAMIAADKSLAAAKQPIWFGSKTGYAEPEELPVLAGKVERVRGEDGRPNRVVRLKETTTETLPVVRRFRANQKRRLPKAWAITGPPPEVITRLTWHGIQFAAVKSKQTVKAQRFHVTKKRKPKRPYQGHQELVLEGDWQPASNRELPLGTIVIPANQPLARLAATLLEPLSEDSLSSWNFLEEQTGDFYPVLRLVR